MELTNPILDHYLSSLYIELSVIWFVNNLPIDITIKNIPIAVDSFSLPNNFYLEPNYTKTEEGSFNLSISYKI